MNKKTKFRTIYLLPNLLTIVNIFFGYLSLSATFHGKFLRAAFWILMAAVLDAFDGIIARATRTQSDFGIQLDSLADAISSATASSFLIYFWGFSQVSPSSIGGFFSFIFLIAGILRLARYNAFQKFKIDRRFYTGLTVPSASLLIVALVLKYPEPVKGTLNTFLLAILVLGLSLCMISTIQYRSFLSFNFRQIIDPKTSLILAMIIGSLIIFPKECFLVVLSFNAISGPSTQAFIFFKKKILKKPTQKESEASQEES